MRVGDGRERISPSEIEEAKTADLATIIGAHVRLKKRGNAFWGCCPFHSEKTPSFKVENGRYICFGCDKKGDAISWVREAEHLSFEEAVRRLSRSSAPVRFCGVQVNTKRRDWAEARKAREAEAIWNAGRPAKGTLVEAYLRARGIRLPMSDQLRYAPFLPHTESAQSLPAMLGRLSDNSGFRAVQRTYLDPHEAKKASVTPTKKTKGGMGGGAVRLRMPPADHLGLAEGIETALSASQLYSLPVWATLSAHRLSKVEIPEAVRNLVIFGDSGDVGRTEAFKAADLYEAAGYHVECIFPAADFKCAPNDFNDAVRAQ